MPRAFVRADSAATPRHRRTPRAGPDTPRPHPRRLPRPSNAALGASRAPLAASPAREQGGSRVRRHHRAGVVSAGLTARASSLGGCRVVAGPAGARARRQIAVTPRASWSDKPSSAAPPGDDAARDARRAARVPDAARGSDWGAAPIPPMPPMPPPPVRGRARLGRDGTRRMVLSGARLGEFRITKRVGRARPGAVSRKLPRFKRLLPGDSAQTGRASPDRPGFNPHHVRFANDSRPVSDREQRGELRAAQLGGEVGGPVRVL